MSDTVLTAEERVKRAAWEQTIEIGLQNQFEMGRGLGEINAHRLYRDTHATFEDYVNDRWDFERGWAYQLMAAAAVRENLAGQFDILPQNEFQARPLAKLTPEQQRTAWQQVVDQVNDGYPITQKLVKGVVDDLAEASKPQPVEPDQVDSQSSAPAGQFRQGDPKTLVGELPPDAFDLLMISNLAGSSSASMAQELTALLDAAQHAMKSDHQVLVVTELPDYRDLVIAAETLGYEFGVPLVWATESERSFANWSAKSSAQYVLHLRRGGAGLARQIGNVISCPAETFKKHPSQQPLTLIRLLIEVTTRPGDRVLDPTAGPATSLIACRQIGRDCVAIESDQDAYAAGVERLNEIQSFEQGA